jgi:hypothetical protein
MAAAALALAGCSTSTKPAAIDATRTLKFASTDRALSGAEGSRTFVRIGKNSSWAGATEVSRGGSIEISTQRVEMHAFNLTCESNTCGTAAFLEALPDRPSRTVDLIPCTDRDLVEGTRDAEVRVMADHVMAAGGDKLICVVRGAE